MSKKLEKLMAECKSRTVNCSITYQKINEFSVEIYTGYKKCYVKYFYSDGHLTAKAAIRKGLKYINKSSN